MSKEAQIRLDRQMNFLCEMDRLKSVLRATRLHDDSRFENSAEHSWHIAMYALTLAEYAPKGCDMTKVVQMLLLHDVVEIDAGDNPIHGDYNKKEMEAKEQLAADRLFGLLPEDQAAQFRNLWDEFEAATSPEAKFAKALDRIPAPLANMDIGGGSWTEYNVTLEDLDQRVGTPIETGAPAMWNWLRPKIRDWFQQRGLAE